MPGNSATHSRIMEPLQVVEQIGPGFVPGAVVGAVYALPLEHAEEPLACRVVAAMADRAHAGDHGIAAQELLVGAADELAAAIRMQDYFVVAFPLPHHHLHCPNDHVAVLAMMHRPTHHLLAVQIQHHAQEQLALERRAR